MTAYYSTTPVSWYQIHWRNQSITVITVRHQQSFCSIYYL